MTEACGGAGRERVRAYSNADGSCESSPEEIETKKQESSQAAGDGRRDEWIAGMSRGATSLPAGSLPAGSPSCEGPTAADLARDAAAQRSHDMHMASAAHTALRDRPLQDDVIGNAVPGLVAGGVVSGARALGSSALPSLASRPVAKLATEKGVEALAHESGALAGTVAKHTAEHVVADGVHHAAEHGAHAIAGHGSHAPAHLPSTSEAAAPGASEQAEGAPAPAGRSGSRAVSEPAYEPAGKSEAAPPAGRDAVPHAPGRAPIRIPEAPAPVTMVIRG